MLVDKRDDEDLIRAYQDGDLSALEILLKRYETPLRNYIAIKCFVKDPHFIADILQEVLTIVFREISTGKFRPQRPGSFRSWVYQVAKHQYLNAMNKLRPQAKAISTYYPEEFPGDLDEVRPEPNIDPLVFNQQCEQINQALDKLEPLERKLYSLKNLGTPYKQIKADPDFSRFTLLQLRHKFSEIIEKLRRLTKSTDSA